MMGYGYWYFLDNSTTLWKQQQKVTLFDMFRMLLLSVTMILPSLIHFLFWDGIFSIYISQTLQLEWWIDHLSCLTWWSHFVYKILASGKVSGVSYALFRCWNVGSFRKLEEIKTVNDFVVSLRGRTK